MDRLIISEAEEVTGGDLTQIGVLADAGLADLTGDAIGYPAHWAGFTVAQSSTTAVTITPGRYFEASQVFASASAIVQDLQAFVPVSANDEKWVAILVRGETVTVNEARSFMTDVENETVAELQTPKTVKRQVTITVQQGLAAPAPALKPAIANGDCAIAFVKLTLAGIALIEAGTDYRVRSLAQVEARVTSLEVNLTALFLRTESLETDVANLAARMPSENLEQRLRQLERDAGATRRQLQLPDGTRAYWFDPGLVNDWWDFEHAGANFRVREGIRFPHANIREARMEVINESDPKIIVHADRKMLPAYTEVTRIAHEGRQITKRLNQLSSISVDITRREVAREVIDYGTVKKVCTNAQYWANLTRGLEVGQTFFHEGETYQLVTAQGATTGVHTDKWRYVRQVIRRTWTKPYWDAEKVETTVNGSVHAQTFLCAQPMIVTSVELDFVSVAQDGTLHIHIAECDPGGKPAYDKVIASVSVLPAALGLGWQKITVPPTLLDSGKRYAVVMITTGGHQVYATNDGSYGGGSLFVSTDGAWAQGSLTEDIAFRINAARFTNVRTEVEFEPLTLENGMTDIRIIGQMWAPGGTEFEWEIRPVGADRWYTLEEHTVAGHPLNGLPALTQIRAVFVGTQDLQPMVQVNAALRATAYRSAGTMTAVSVNHPFGLSSDAIEVLVKVDAWIAAEHAITPQIITASGTESADAVETIVDPDDDAKRTFRCVFDLAATVTAARVKIAMTASNVKQPPFIEDISIHAL